MWLIIGDESYAALACDTGGKAFGPLHSAIRGNAKEEMLYFVTSFPSDPRKMSEEELDRRYWNWLQRQPEY